MAKSGIFHKGFQVLLPGVHADGFGQIPVAVGITRHQLTQLGKDLEAVPVVGFFQRFGHFGKFQNQQFPARLEHAAHLFERHILVGHVAQAECDTDHMEVAIGKGQLFGIAHQGGQGQTMVHQAITPRGEHGFIDVGVHHTACDADFFGKRHRQVTRATCDVQHLIAFFQVGHLHGVGLPHAVQAHGHQVVHHVVFGGDRVEHAAHVLGFLAFVDGFETEVGAAHCPFPQCL